jgi:hypothetical protein
MTWFAQNAPAISTDIQNVLALVQAVGLANSPGVATAIQDANLSLSQPSICLLPCAEVSQRALVIAKVPTHARSSRASCRQCHTGASKS